MTVKEIAEELNLKYLSCKDADCEVKGCYCGDLLSWVMSRAQAGDAWLTVMGNINSIGVAVLAETACIILTENAPLDENARERAEQNGVIILGTPKTSYEIASAVSRLI